MWTALIGVLGTISGVVIGYWLNQRTRNQLEKRARLGRLHAVRVEVEQCGNLLRTFVTDRVMAPLYRLPTWASQTTLGLLLAEGLLEEEQVQALLRYYRRFDEFNRGLDRAGNAAAAHDTTAIQDESSRLEEKARQILHAQTPGGLSLQQLVERVLRDAIVEASGLLKAARINS